MGKFTVGTAKLDITPGLGCHMCGYFNDRLSTDIHDPLYVKALSISDGEREIGLILVDTIYLPQFVVEKSKELIAAKTGVDAEHVLISATHTHTGPAIVALLGAPEEPGYAESVIPKIVDAFTLAHNSRVPAEIAHASGDVHEEVHNRRWHMKDGTTVMNPGYKNPNAVCPAGPTDPQLGLLIARDPETKKPLALYANLALHYVGPMKVHTIISADYFEFFAYAMQRIAGEDFLVMMANGTQGNINNCDFTQPPRTSRTNFQQAERVANVCAGEAWKAWNLLRDEDFKTEGFVDGKLTMVPFKARTPTAEQLEESKRTIRISSSTRMRSWKSRRCRWIWRFPSRVCASTIWASSASTAKCSWKSVWTRRSGRRSRRRWSSASPTGRSATSRRTRRWTKAATRRSSAAMSVRRKARASCGRTRPSRILLN